MPYRRPGSPAPRARSAWMIPPPSGAGDALARELTAHGWNLAKTPRGLHETLELLSRGEAVPDVLITGMRLPDGDALALMRFLAELPAHPAMFLISRQQRSVVKAAAALAATLGVDLAGQAEVPLRMSDVTSQLDAFLARPPLRPRTNLLSTLGNDEVRKLHRQGGMRAFLQPKMKLANHAIVGFETLLRGVRTDGTIVGAPALLQPLIDCGLLPDVTLQLFDQTIAFLVRCLGEGMAVGASVNVPLSLVSDERFCQEIVARVEGAGLDPSWVTLEVTESEAMLEPAITIENAARIRMLGFNLSIDDFGTAYSSFAQLVRIPFSELKIERAFIDGIDVNRSNQAVVSACALLGASMGMSVVAEGVETIEELEAVRATGCTAIQGFLLSRPMAAEDALSWLSALEGQRFEVHRPVAASPDSSSARVAA